MFKKNVNELFGKSVSCHRSHEFEEEKENICFALKF